MMIHTSVHNIYTSPEVDLCSFLSFYHMGLHGVIPWGYFLDNNSDLFVF